jgi:hypothetical protein
VTLNMSLLSARSSPCVTRASRFRRCDALPKGSNPVGNAGVICYHAATRRPGTKRIQEDIELSALALLRICLDRFGYPEYVDRDSS